MRILIFLPVFILKALLIIAQTTIIHRDPQIEKMVSLVSKDSPEAYIIKIINFGNRINTRNHQPHMAKEIFHY